MASNIRKVLIRLFIYYHDNLDSINVLCLLDPLEGKIGIASDYGKQYINIGRVPEPDAILYQTERYHHSNFGYDIPVSEDGDYVLVLKFCEVYFNSPSMKVSFSTLSYYLISINLLVDAGV